jgi:hypothetical protein
MTNNAAELLSAYSLNLPGRDEIRGREESQRKYPIDRLAYGFEAVATASHDCSIKRGLHIIKG